MIDRPALLKQIFTEARPYVEQLVELNVVFTGFRKLATDNGMDWGQIKALLRAQIEDGDAGSEKVDRIIKKAEFAGEYAALLGLGTSNMNNCNSNSTVPILQAKLPPHDSETGEIIETELASGAAIVRPEVGETAPVSGDAGENETAETSRGRPAEISGGTDASPNNSESAGALTTADAAAGSDPRPDASLPPRTSSDDPGDIPAFLDRRSKAA